VRKRTKPEVLEHLLFNEETFLHYCVRRDKSSTVQGLASNRSVTMDVAELRALLVTCRLMPSVFSRSRYASRP